MLKYGGHGPEKCKGTKSRFVIRKDPRFNRLLNSTATVLKIYGRYVNRYHVSIEKGGKMKIWTTTRIDTVSTDIVQGTKASGGHFFAKGGANVYEFDINIPDLERKLEALLETLQMENWDVVSVIPLQSGLASTRHGFHGMGAVSNSYGYGHGFGVALTTGATVISKKTEEVTDDVYQSRWHAEIRPRQIEAMIKSVNEKKTHLPSLAKLMEKKQSDLDTLGPLQEKTGMFGGAKIRVGKKDFGTKEEAEAYVLTFKRARDEAKSKYEMFLTEIEDMERQISDMS